MAWSIAVICPAFVRGNGRWPRWGTRIGSRTSWWCRSTPLGPAGCPDPRTDRSPSCCCPCKRQGGRAV